MKPRMFVVVALALAALGAWGVRAQSTEPEPPPPLYQGVDSVGARPAAQPAAPALYFEARAHWPSLGVETPRTAWEYAQRGIYRQDTLEDVEGAVQDYLQAEALDDHLLIVQGRLAYLALERGRAAEADGRDGDADLAYQEAVDRYEAVLYEQPERQGLRLRMAEAHLGRSRVADPGATADAIEALEAELELAPTQQAAFFALGRIHAAAGRAAEARRYLEAYLEESARAGEPYPYKRLEARRLLDTL